MMLFEGKGEDVVMLVMFDLVEGHFGLLDIFLNRLSVSVLVRVD